MSLLVVLGGAAVLLLAGVLSGSAAGGAMLGTTWLAIGLFVLLVRLGSASSPHRYHAARERNRSPRSSWNALWIRGIPSAGGAETVAGRIAITAGLIGLPLLAWAVLKVAS